MMRKILRLVRDALATEVLIRLDSERFEAEQRKRRPHPTLSLWHAGYRHVQREIRAEENRA